MDPERSVILPIFTNKWSSPDPNQGSLAPEFMHKNYMSTLWQTLK